MELRAEEVAEPELDAVALFELAPRDIEPQAAANAKPAPAIAVLDALQTTDALMRMRQDAGSSSRVNGRDGGVR